MAASHHDCNVYGTFTSRPDVDDRSMRSNSNAMASERLEELHPVRSRGSQRSHAGHRSRTGSQREKDRSASRGTNAGSTNYHDDDDAAISEDEDSEGSFIARPSTSHSHESAQAGVKRLEAIATTWSKTGLYVAYLG